MPFHTTLSPPPAHAQNTDQLFNASKIYLNTDNAISMKPDPEIPSTNRKSAPATSQSLFVRRLGNRKPTPTQRSATIASAAAAGTADGPHIQPVAQNVQTIVMYVLIAVILICCALLDHLLAGPLWTLCNRASQRLRTKRSAAAAASASALSPATNLQYVKYDEPSTVTAAR